MSADEIFLQLGYEKEEKTDIFLVNKHWIFYRDDKQEIAFALDYKEVIFSKKEALKMQELKAINQKCKELGWIE